MRQQWGRNRRQVPKTRQRAKVSLGKNTPDDLFCPCLLQEEERKGPLKKGRQSCSCHSYKNNAFSFTMKKKRSKRPKFFFFMAQLNFCVFAAALWLSSSRTQRKIGTNLKLRRYLVNGSVLAQCTISLSFCYINSTLHCCHFHVS